MSTRPAHKRSQCGRSSVSVLHPDPRRFALAKRDAHGLYRKFGFSELAGPSKPMEIFRQFMNYNRAMKKLVVAAFAATLSVFSAAAADISGSWTMTGEVVGNSIDMKCAFTQAGAKLTGNCTGARGATPTTGSVADNAVTFQISVNQGQVYELTYTGTLDAAGTSMKGEIAVMGVSGTFSAKKDAATSQPAKESAAPDAAGTWTITGDVVGNAINMKCALKRDGAKLSGTCTYQDLGDSPTAGSVTGDKITFQNHVVREQPYDLTYNGTMDASGTSMNGDIAVAGVTGTFSGTKDK